MKLELYDNLHFKVNTEDREILLILKNEFSEYTDGYLFSPKYRAGVWDGKIYLFSIYDKILPYGLLTEFLAIRKKLFPNIDIEVSQELKDLIATDPFFDSRELEKCEPWDYREYQEACIRKSLKYKKCILRAATSAGKSYIIAGILKNLLHYDKVQNSIIIVPSTSLVEQFYKDLLDYGFYKENLGRVYSKFKDWDKKIVISTWQTLKNQKDRVKDFECVIVDEVHGVRGIQLRDILKCSNAEYRIGCTGTMPESRLECMNIKSYLGPIVKEVTASELANKGFISSVQILQYWITYKQKFSSDYHEAKTEIFQNPFRMNIIKNIVNDSKKSILLLVGKVETEGEYLKQYLINTLEYDEDTIVFINGDMSTTDREIWRQKIINNPEKKYIILATYGVFSTGINVPNLSQLLFAAPFKSTIRICQSIGRILRLFSGKNGSIVYDLVDDGNKWFPKHGDIRLRIYDKEKFEVIEKRISE